MSRATETAQQPAQRLYDLKAAATYLGRSVYAMRELVWSRQLPIIRSGPGGKQYIDVKDLDAFIEKNKGLL